MILCYQFIHSKLTWPAGNASSVHTRTLTRAVILIAQYHCQQGHRPDHLCISNHFSLSVYSTRSLTWPADDHTMYVSCCGHVQDDATITPADPERAVQTSVWTSGVEQSVDVTRGTGRLVCVRCGDRLCPAFCPHTGTCLLPPAGTWLPHTDTGPITERLENTLTQDLQHSDV